MYMYIVLDKYKNVDPLLSVPPSDSRLTVRDTAELILPSEDSEVVVDRQRLQREARLVNITRREAGREFILESRIMVDDGDL